MVEKSYSKFSWSRVILGFGIAALSLYLGVQIRTNTPLRIACSILVWLAPLMALAKKPLYVLGAFVSFGVIVSSLFWFPKFVTTKIEAAHPVLSGFGLILYGIVGLISMIGVLSLMIEAFSDSRRTQEKAIYEAKGYSSSGYSHSGGETKSGRKEVSPIFKTSKIEENIWGKKVLKGPSGETEGKLTAGGLFDSKQTQIILDKDEQKVGKITEGGLFDSKDTQIIRDKSGGKVGRIETNIWGERIIKDSSGEKIGKITKNIWGKTVIEKMSNKYDESKSEDEENEVECPNCGCKYDYDTYGEYCPECDEEEEEE